MICAHCNETISVWRSFSIPRRDGGFKCSVCGKVSFAESIHRRDPIATIMVLGYVAVFVLFLFLTPETGTQRYLRFLGAIAALGFIAMSIALAVRASKRIVTVASRPPRDIRQQRWFFAAWLVCMISILGYFVMRWLHVGEGIAWAAMMICALIFFVVCFSGRPSRTRPTDPFKQD